MSPRTSTMSSRASAAFPSRSPTLGRRPASSYRSSPREVLTQGDTMDASLQMLTDGQIKRRLAAYADDGRFTEAMRRYWDAVGDLTEDATRRHFGDDEAALV